MNQPTYNVVYSQSEKQYTFKSIGKHGNILKVVKFIEFQYNVYNLGFGDFDPSKKQVDDTIVTNNGDMTKVLATIVSIIAEFLSANPVAHVFFEGSTKSRTRLYQIAINRYYDEFSQTFEIFGLDGDKFETFKKNKSYESFLIRKMF
jgi:hypothetical protein